MGDLGEMRHDHLGEWKNELTRGKCWGCQCFLLVRIQFPAILFYFLLSQIIYFEIIALFWPSLA